MREIKFRVWFDDIKSMWKWADLTHLLGLGHFISEAHNRDHYVLMQYTGLTDKNGVEVYEGDICEWHIPDMGRPEPDAMIRYVSVVEYRNGSFNLSGYLFPNVRLIKVLGNIYENPELLEVAE